MASGTFVMAVVIVSEWAGFENGILTAGYPSNWVSKMQSVCFEVELKRDGFDCSCRRKAIEKHPVCPRKSRSL